MTQSLPPRPSLTHIDVMAATWFGSGYLPKAPGTWGSLAALPFAAVIMWYAGTFALIACAVALVPVGVWAATRYAARTGTTDAGPVVIDEVVGQWLTLAPLVVVDWFLFLVGFILFRAFDVLKPWPIGWIDRNVKGGLGVMLDDVVAGFFAAAVLWSFIWVIANVSA